VALLIPAYRIGDPFEDPAHPLAEALGSFGYFCLVNAVIISGAGLLAWIRDRRRSRRAEAKLGTAGRGARTEPLSRHHRQHRGLPVQASALAAVRRGARGVVRAPPAIASVDCMRSSEAPTAHFPN
jgi:hypothetical protein